jgi:tetratricopeptide (TPR) repeat protein
VPVHRQDLALTHNLLRERGKLPQAEAAYRRALGLHAQLAADFPAVPEHRHLLAGSYNNLGILLRQRGKYAEAEAAHRQAVAITERLAADFPAVPEYRRDLAVSGSSLGKGLRELGKLAEAEMAHRQALAQWEKLAADFPATPHYRAEHAGNLVNFGGLLLKQHRPTGALACYDRALALLGPLNAQEPRDAYILESLRYAHRGRAEALDDLKRHGEALAAWDQALELATPADRPRVQLGRAGSRLRAGESAEAEAEVEALTQDPLTPGSILCEGASTYARAAAAFPYDAPRRGRYAGQALTLLRRAQAVGFLKDRRRVEHLKHAADSEALRPREDFQQFLAELEAALAEP